MSSVDPDFDHDDDTLEDEFSTLDIINLGVTAATVLAAPVAMAVSYAKNASVPWAIAHGVVAVPYLILTALRR